MSLEQWKKKVLVFRNKFIAREDLFSIRTPHTVMTTDKLTGETKLVEEARVMPACKNYGNQKLCLITQKSGGCAECANRVFQPVTDEVIWKHISGEQEIILFMLREEGIRFGAADFDKGNTFEDAKSVRALSQSYGIPCHIAKSTKKGYHVYWFFKDFVQPHEFTSYIRHIFEELGFYQRWAVTPEVGIPEVFPKQTVYRDNKIGNGIKVPMMEPRMKEGRNCWVTDLGEPVKDQWAFIEEAESIDVEAFRNVLAEKGVEILKAPASRSRQLARKAEGKEEGQATGPKPFGDFWNVVEGCPALQEYWAKGDDGRYVWDHNNPKGLFHDARVASMMIGIATTNGADVLKERWPTDKTASAISHAQASGYTPVTCRWMQDKRICHIGKHPKCGGGTYCMKKIPPVEYENGKRSVNPDNLPEEQWPEPSPIRFATDRNLTVDDIIERLALIFKALKEKSRKTKKKKDEDKEATQYLPSNPVERIEGLLSRAAALGKEEFSKVESAIELNRWMTKSELATHKKRLMKDAAEKKNEVSRQSSVNSFRFGAYEYRFRDGVYWKCWTDTKGIPQEAQLTNYHCIVHEEREVVMTNDNDDLEETGQIRDRAFAGTFYCEGKKFPFDVPYREWQCSSDTWFKTVLKVAGSALIHFRAEYDHIRTCINEFSKEHRRIRRLTREVGYHTLRGRRVYIMPSVIIDKDVIKANDEFSVDTFRNEVSKFLDFSVISEDEFKKLARHIIDDYFTCDNSIITMTTFAHAMAAVMLPQINSAVGYNKSPVLWLAGSFSKGKTFAALAAQNFFGNFDYVQSSSGSYKSKINAGHDFRHAMMLVDDYKRYLSDKNGTEMPSLIQMTYDRTARPVLQRDGTPREVLDRVRGLLVVTGEDLIENDASAISRVISIDVEFNMNRVSGDKVIANKRQYNGFTPYLIQFILNLTNEEIEEWWHECYGELFNNVSDKHKQLGAHRVCENLALNAVAFKVTMEMLASRGAIPEVERDELCRRHMMNLAATRAWILNAVEESIGSRVFVNALVELIQSPGRMCIRNMPGSDWDGRTVVGGFYKTTTPDIIYLYPQTVHGLVTDLVSKAKGHVQTISHIARQLYEEDIIVRELVARERSSYTVSVRGPEHKTVRAWPIRAEKIGLSFDEKGNVKKETSGPKASLSVISQSELPFDTGTDKH